jgi:hypothetical protein
MDQNHQVEKKSSTVEFEAITLGVPNRNNRIYPKEVMEKALKDYQELIDRRIAFVTVYRETWGPVLCLNDAIGLVNEAVVKDNKLMVKVTPFQKNTYITPELFNVAPFGVATLKDNVVQDDYRISGFHIDPKS